MINNYQQLMSCVIYLSIYVISIYIYIYVLVNISNDKNSMYVYNKLPVNYISN